MAIYLLFTFQCRRKGTLTVTIIIIVDTKKLHIYTKLQPHTPHVCKKKRIIGKKYAKINKSTLSFPIQSKNDEKFSSSEILSHVSGQFQGVLIIALVTLLGREQKPQFENIETCTKRGNADIEPKDYTGECLSPFPAFVINVFHIFYGHLHFIIIVIFNNNFAMTLSDVTIHSFLFLPSWLDHEVISSIMKSERFDFLYHT